MKGFSHSVRKTTDTAHGLRVLARAGMIPRYVVGRSFGALKEVRRWGPLVGALRNSARHRTDAIGLVDEQGPLTYRELDVRSDALALALRERGFEPGHTVAVLCRDHRWMIESLLACGKLGVHVLLLNTGFAAPQLADVVDREQAHALIHDDEFTDIVVDARMRLPRFIAWREHDGRCDEPTLEELIAETVAENMTPPPSPGSIVLLTSGTTGRPKGAKREIRSGLTAADFLDRIPLRAAESTFVAAPMFHAVGFSQLILGFALGSTLVVHRRFDAQRVVHAVRQHGCSALILVPTMLQRLLDLDPANLSASLASLRVVLLSGSPLLPTLCVQATGALGDVLYNLYGSTEAAVVSVATPTDLRTAPGTVGRSPRTCVLGLFDEHGERITRAHVPGRVFAGGALTFSGYTGNSTSNDHSGLVSTGDVGHFDDNGLLFIDGRADDMIISGGENVFPSEVENLIARHYKVKDVAVVGLADREFGQRLRAFVVPVPGTDLVAAEVRDYVRESLAKHKVPRDVIMVDTVPRNSTGKVLRQL